uniref:Peptidase A1 domain-containing protein n=1 Tax=Oryza rufipogon TaxID=4529 RepID=A0A0E0P670_ORYRU
MKGKLTHGKVAESRFDKRSYDSKPPPKNLPLPQNGLPQSVGKGSLLCFLKAKGWASSLSVGKPAAIQYGNGSVAGFFNEDSVTIGDLVVKDQIQTYSFSLLLKIAYYYFPGAVLNFLNNAHILDVLVIANNVIAQQEVQGYLNICWQMMCSVLRILLHCFRLWFA